MAEKKSVPCVLNDAQKQLVSENIMLVARVLQRGGLMGLEYDDAFQIGAMGLMRAAAFFDAERGIQFSTYATRSIKRELASDLRARMAARRGGGEKPLSLDAPNHENGCTRGECTSDTRIGLDDIEDQLITREAITEFRRVVSRRAREGIMAARAAQMYWLESVPQAGIAAQLGVTEKHVTYLIWQELRRFRSFWR